MDNSLLQAPSKVQVLKKSTGDGRTIFTIHPKFGMKIPEISQTFFTSNEDCFLKNFRNDEIVFTSVVEDLFLQEFVLRTSLHPILRIRTSFTAVRAY